MNLIEGIKSALLSLWSNKLRSFLTLFMVSIGVMAIVGVGSAMDWLQDSTLATIDEVGGNSFVIKKTPSLQMHGNWKKYAKRKPIYYAQSNEYKKEVGDRAIISVADDSPGTSVKFGSKSTDRTVTMWGVDENYFRLRNKKIAYGRAILQQDLVSNSPVVVIGNDIVTKVFEGVNPLGKDVMVRGHHYTVVGILETQGAILGQSQDNEVYVPMTNYISTYTSEYYFSGTVTVKAENKEVFDRVFDESIGVMRLIRNLKPWEENDFEVEDNAVLVGIFDGFLSFVRWFAYICGLFAIVAAGIGIANIMLISVRERTKEIGIRKAIGSPRNAILIQFLIEAVTISLVGCIVGVILVGALITGIRFAFDIALPFPFPTFIGSVVLCTVVGILSGLVPAFRASQLDPIEALRFE